MGEGEGSYFFSFNKTWTTTKYICWGGGCFKTHHLTGLSLQENLSFWNKRSDSFLISWGWQTPSKDMLSFHDMTTGKFFLRKADEILTNPTSQRKAILQKAPQRKGGISFLLQRCFCVMLWKGGPLGGGVGSELSKYPCGLPQLPLCCPSYAHPPLGMWMGAARKKVTEVRERV